MPLRIIAGVKPLVLSNQYRVSNKSRDFRLDEIVKTVNHLMGLYPGRGITANGSMVQRFG